MKRLIKALRPLVSLRSEVNKKWQTAIFAMAILTIVLAYTWLVYDPDNKLLPHWGKLWFGLKQLIYNSQFNESYLKNDTIASFSRLLPAVAIASVLGVVLGMYMGVYAAAEAFFGRILVFIGNIPPNTVMVAFMIYFGFALKMYMAVIIFGIITMIAKGVFQAVKAISNEHIYSAKTLGGSSSEIVWSILFFQVLPHILEAIRQSIAPAMVYLIAAEWSAGANGYGYRFMMFSRTGRMELIFPYVMYLGVIGILTMLLFSLATRILCPWYSRR